jgi:hypothetical protein
VAEWLRRGLQILASQFDSGRGLQFLAHTPNPIRLANFGHRGFNHRPSFIVETRLKRRTTAKSIERMMSPSGNIQKPSMGKKPNRPPTTRITPSAIRNNGCAGTRTRNPKNSIFCKFLSLAIDIAIKIKILSSFKQNEKEGSLPENHLL